MVAYLDHTLEGTQRGDELRAFGRKAIEDRFRQVAAAEMVAAAKVAAKKQDRTVVANTRKAVAIQVAAQTTQELLVQLDAPEAPGQASAAVVDSMVFKVLFSLSDKLGYTCAKKSRSRDVDDGADDITERILHSLHVTPFCTDVNVMSISAMEGLQELSLEIDRRNNHVCGKVRRKALLSADLLPVNKAWQLTLPLSFFLFSPQAHILMVSSNNQI